MVQKEIPKKGSNKVQLFPILVASGGGGAGLRDGLPGSGYHGQLPGTMVDIRNGRMASGSSGGEGGKTIGFTNDDMIHLGHSSGALKWPKMVVLGKGVMGH